MHAVAESVASSRHNNVSCWCSCFLKTTGIVVKESGKLANLNSSMADSQVYEHGNEVRQIKLIPLLVRGAKH